MKKLFNIASITINSVCNKELFYSFFLFLKLIKTIIVTNSFLGTFIIDFTNNFNFSA